ncbi:hypothetical protein D3C75_1060090 [compost metagenome]
MPHSAPARIARRFAFRHRDLLDHWFDILAERNIAFSRIGPVNALHAACRIRLAFRCEHVVHHFDQSHFRFFTGFVGDDELGSR